MITRIAHITDLHLDEDFPFKSDAQARNRFEVILSNIEENNISNVVCTGDIGESSGVSYFFEKLKNKSVVITLGNHDNFATIVKYYKQGANYRTEKFYQSITSDFFKYIYLDSSVGIIDDEQLDWLQKEIEIEIEKVLVVFIHHPIIGVPYKVDEIGKLKNREKVLTLLTSVTNQVNIYCGHYHMESVNSYENITQYITPAVSFQIEKDTNEVKVDTKISGYRIIEIEEQELSSEVKFVRYTK